MGMEALLVHNPLEWLTKCSEESIDLVNRRQRKFQETTESLMGVFRETMEMKPAAEPLRKLCGNVYELFNAPLEVFVERAKWEDAVREMRDLAGGMPGSFSGNGFSEELTAYGKSTWENSSRVSSACIEWMKHLVLEQKITADRKEAGQAAKNCLEATESFFEESLACCLDQLRANCGFLKAGVLKGQGHTDPAQ
jgi:hypothetical protein